VSVVLPGPKLALNGPAPKSHSLAPCPFSRLITLIETRYSAKNAMFIVYTNCSRGFHDVLETDKFCHQHSTMNATMFLAKFGGSFTNRPNKLHPVLSGCVQICHFYRTLSMWGDTVLYWSDCISPAQCGGTCAKKDVLRGRVPQNESYSTLMCY